MTIRFFSKLFIILICTLPCLAHAHFTISPIKLKFTNETKVGSLTIKNEAETNSNFQLTLYKVTKEHGKEVFHETKDLIAVPAAFQLKGNSTQLIRVALKDNVVYSKDDVYQLAVRQLPHKSVVQQTVHAVHFAAEFRVPIVIEHATGDKPEEAKVQ